MNKYLYDIITSQGSLSIEDIFLRIAIAALFAIVVSFLIVLHILAQFIVPNSILR